jgi:hypothetical protein
MKKKLLFSLLLGSAFAWMNEVYAADTAAAPAAEKAKPTGDKAGAPKVEKKEYKLKTYSGGALGEEMTFFTQGESPETIYKEYSLLDGGIWLIDTDMRYGQMKPDGQDSKNNVPFIVGVKGAPKGYKVVSFWFPIDASGDKEGWGGKYKEDLSQAIIALDNNISTPPKEGYTTGDYACWKLLSDNDEIIFGETVQDPNAQDFFGTGNQKTGFGADKVQSAVIRKFRVPDEEGTAKLQEALKKSSDLEEKLKSAGTGAGSPEDAARVKELETQIEELKKNAGNGAAPAVDPSAPLTKTFQFEGMNFVIITSDPAAKSHPELFEELKSNLYKLFSIQPKVGTAIAAMMLKSHESLDGSQGEFVKILVADAYKLMGSDKTINLVAELQFPTEVAYQDAYAYVEGLKNKYNRDDAIREATQPVSAEEAARRQAEHENELAAERAKAETELAAERAKAETELAAERAKGEEILEQLEQITKEKAAAEAEMKLAEEEKEKAIQQRNVAIDVGIEIASSAIDQADQKAQMAAQNAQIAAQNAQIATHNAQIAAQKDAQVQSVEEALNESELEKQKALNKAEAEKARLAAAHQQTQSTLEETKNDLMETKISEATLTAQHNAAKEAAEKAEKDAAAVKKQLEDAHGALLDVATSTSNSTENVTAEQVAQDLDDANKHAPITREEQVTAAALTASAPLPLSNSMVISDKKTASIIPDINKIAPGTVSTVTPAE